MKTKPKHYRFDSCGIPEALQGYPHWGGWRDGHALPFTFTEYRRGRILRWGYFGRMVPTRPETGADWQTALRLRRQRGFDGVVFMPFDAPFLFLTLHDAVRKVGSRAHHHRVNPSAARVLRECATYAEVAPNEKDVTLVVEVDQDWRRRRVGGGRLPTSVFPPDFPVHEYDGVAAHTRTLFPIPLTGLFIGTHSRVRYLPPEPFEEVH